jgi:hypothetical protein
MRRGSKEDLPFAVNRLLARELQFLLRNISGYGRVLA